MFSDAKSHMIYKLRNAPIREFPSPHIYLESVFSQEFYEKLENLFPDESAFLKIHETGVVAKGVYDERHIFQFNKRNIEKLPITHRHFWHSFSEWIMGNELMMELYQKFEPYLHLHPILKDKRDNIQLYSDAKLAYDLTNYSIGPHTDHPSRLLSFIYYMPEDDDKEQYGTSFYVPKDSSFTCPGGPHHNRSLFDSAYTAPYKKNSMIVFFKTANSFHGVDPIREKRLLRRSIQYVARIEA